MAEAGDHGLPEFEILECLKLQILGYPTYMFPEEIHFGSVCPQERHTVGVYVLRRDTRWECMFPEETNLGSVCSQKRHTLGMYVPREDTPWERMFSEETHFGIVHS